MRPSSSRRVLAEGRFARLVAQDGWEWVERTNTSAAVVIAAITDDQQVVLIDQYRIPLAARVIELPAGLVGDLPGSEEEAQLEAARRELLEETGFEARHWQHLIEGPASAGLASEMYTLYLARGAHRVGPGGGDGTEDIAVHVVPLAELESWLQSRRKAGALVDPKVYIGLYFATNNS
jgi:ADP-ribose pyrophosphatase